jgi:HEAT repeat protein
MKRAKLPAMKRNAAVALGNGGTEEGVAVLARALGDCEPLVREHAAWTLRRIGIPAAREARRARLAVAPEARLRQPLESAIGALVD